MPPETLTDAQMNSMTAPMKPPSTLTDFQIEQMSQPNQPQSSLSHKAGSVMDAIFGGGKIGEALGTGIGYLMTPEKDRNYYDTTIPTTGQLFGSALQSASLFTPIGKIAGFATGALGKAGLKTGAKILGDISAGAAAGLPFDVALNLQEEKTGTEVVTPGLATGIGAALPLIPPVAKGIGRGVAETLGVSTGIGYGAIKGLFDAASKGGEIKQAAVDALRKNTTPEQIVNEAKDALLQIKKSRNDAYVNSLATLKENTQSYDIVPIIDSVKTNLYKFGVSMDRSGTLDFSRSPIRFNNEAQKDITQIVDVMKDFGSRKGDRTIVGLDSLKRAFDDLYTPSSQARAFVTDVASSVRGILKDVPGYTEMSADYASKSQLINDIAKSLSLGDKASIDTGFRKLTTALRTNNEERNALVSELDAISGGKLIPMIAGQQASEILPRGLARQIEGFGALGLMMTGFGVPLLKMALFASPRVVGEMVNVLGLGARASNYLLKVLGVKGVPFQSPGDVVANKLGQEATLLQEHLASLPNKQGGFIAGTDGEHLAKAQQALREAKGLSASELNPTQQKTLIAVHNLTAPKLAKAEKIGGLANPSIAVFDPKKTNFESFGDITLVAPKETIISRGAKTYGADVYSPRFPGTTTTVDWGKLKSVEKELGIDLHKIDTEDFFRSAENNADVMRKFLEDRGIYVGKGDSYESLGKLREQIAPLSDEYNQFIDDLAEKVGVEERIFKGFTYLGNRRYSKLTVENASKEMNKEAIQGGENFFYGLGSVRAKVAPRFTNLSAMKKAQDRIVSKAEFEKIKEAYETEFGAIIDDLGKYSKYKDKNQFIQSDVVGRNLGDYLAGDRKIITDMFDGVPPELLKKIESFRMKLLTMPTEYFETKFRRPVSLNEFSHALVPEETTQATLKLLENKGISIVKYKKGEQAKKLAEYVAENGLLFSLAGLVMLNQEND